VSPWLQQNVVAVVRYRVEVHDHETGETAVFDHEEVEITTEAILVMREDGEPGVEGSAVKILAWTREGPRQ
jgi:hypothetical protein